MSSSATKGANNSALKEISSYLVYADRYVRILGLPLLESLVGTDQYSGEICYFYLQGQT
jgi:hypothetical protein